MCRKYQFRAGLACLGGLIALTLAEGFIRLFYPETRDHVFPGLLEINRDLGWRLKPNKSALHHSSYFAVDYSINALGYRDSARDVKKPRDVYRILLYGDSEIFGWGIPAGERFSNVVEERIPSLEIWNLAVIGYGLDQEILSYEREGHRFEADEVILFASEATLSRTQYGSFSRKSKPRFVREKDGTLRLIPIPVSDQARTRLLYDAFGFLYLPHFVERRRMMLEAARQSSRGRSAPPQNGVPITELEKELLEKAKGIAVKRAHRLTVLASLPRTPIEDLRSFCEREGIRFLEIEFNGRAPELRLGKYDPHWNVRAHQFIVAQLLPYFMEVGRDARKLPGGTVRERR
jgi:hypothetical protein